MSTTILTGLRANSELTLANYLGGILPIIEIQKKLASDDRFFMFVPDLHSFITPIDHTQLYSNTLNNIRTFLACGFDPGPSNVFLYRQSAIPAHSELAWILNCYTSMGEMSKMTQYKDKALKAQESNVAINVGIFTYPILMAADILLYGAEYVPVGDDQKQHIEIARDIAIRFNNKFTDRFDKGVFESIPKPWKDQLEFMGKTEGVRIRSLTNPESKMSKSDTDTKSCILMSDTPTLAAKKIMSSTTDSLGLIQFDMVNQPGISNLITILSMVSGQDIKEVMATWEGQTRYGDLKKATAHAVEEFLVNFQTKLAAISDQEVLVVLEKGEKQAQIIANETLLRVQRAVGVKN